MEVSDEPDQPVSAGRKEIRRRRRPNQPMVDKSQQTEVAEKKKQLPIPQSSGSQATISIGNIPGSNVNYGSLRISSQLQTWKKRRKYIRDMTDKSLQTDTTEEEKNEAIKAVDETVMPEEKPAAVREGDPEFPESVQEVEISPRRHSVQLKIHRSQQTSCTGVWTMMNIPQKETVDKEQQTDLSESEIMFFGKPGSSFSKSKEGTRKCKSSGDIFVSENPEFQSITSNNEETGQSISKFLFIQQSKNGNTAYLEDEQDISVAVQPTNAGEISAEVQPPATDEAPAEEASAKVEPTPAEEMFSEEPPAEVQPPSTNESSTQEAQELQLPPAEETPAEEASAEVQHSAAEETPTEGASAEVLPLPAEEPPAEETSDEVQSLTAEETHAEEASAEVLPPPAEESPVEEATAEVQPPLDEETSSEEASAEVQPLAAEEALAEEASAEVLPPPAEETPVEETSAEVQPPLDEETSSEEASAEAQPQPAARRLLPKKPQLNLSLHKLRRTLH